MLFGGDGNDSLFGDTGNDTLVGGNGEDTLVGFGGTGDIPEIDTLIGGTVTFDDEGNASVDIFGDGAEDVFVLGTLSNVFYTQAGSDDYAVILDFEIGVDQIQLSPSVNYRFRTGSVLSDLDTAIFANLSTGDDLIAIVVGVDLIA